MGWETGVSSVFNAIQTSNALNTAQANAKAQTLQGQYQAQNIADNTVRAAGTLESSFLQGGISLQGGPQAVLAQAFAKGTTDISRTVTNANNQASNTINQARTNALSQIANQFMKSSGGTSGITSGLSSLNEQSAYALNSAGYGNTAYEMLDPSPGP